MPPPANTRGTRKQSSLLADMEKALGVRVAGRPAAASL